MINFYPTLYRFSASTCGALTTVPIDIMQTKIISNKDIEFKFDELKILFMISTLFSFQNSIYSYTNFIKNNLIRGSISGLSTVPFYILLESKKFYSRLKLKPKYKNFIVWITIRQIIVFATLYSLINYNIKYSKFISAFTANAIGFPIRIFALKKSYPKLNFTLKNIKKSGLLEIIKSSIGDGSTLYLIYNFKYSPFKV